MIRSQRRSTEHCGWMESTQQVSRTVHRARALRPTQPRTMAAKNAESLSLMGLSILVLSPQKDNVFASLQMCGMQVNVMRSPSSKVHVYQQSQMQPRLTKLHQGLSHVVHYLRKIGERGEHEATVYGLPTNPEAIWN